MASAFYEIIELSDGEYALQRSGEEGEPLIIINFSEEARLYLLESGLDVARAMIDAGIHAVESLSSDTDRELLELGEHRVLH